MSTTHSPTRRRGPRYQTILAGILSLRPHGSRSPVRDLSVTIFSLSSEGAGVRLHPAATESLYVEMPATLHFFVERRRLSFYSQIAWIDRESRATTSLGLRMHTARSRPQCQRTYNLWIDNALRSRDRPRV